MELENVNALLNNSFKGYFDVRVDNDKLSIIRYWIYDSSKHDNYRILTDDKNLLGKQYAITLDKSIFNDIYKKASELMNSDSANILTLQDMGLVEGTLTKIDIVNEGATEFECKFTDPDDYGVNITIILPKNEIVGKLELNQSYYVIIKSIKKYPTNYKVIVTMRSPLLVKELMLMKFAQKGGIDNNIEIKDCVRLPGNSTRMIVTGNILDYLPIIDELKSEINEKIYLMTYNHLTPLQILSAFSEFINDIKMIDFDIQVLDQNQNRLNFCYIYVEKALIPKIVGIKLDKIGSARLYQIFKLLGFKVILKDVKEYTNRYESYDEIGFNEAFDESDAIKTMALKNYFYAILNNSTDNIENLLKGNDYNWNKIFESLDGFVTEDDLKFYKEKYSTSFNFDV